MQKITDYIYELRTEYDKSFVKLFLVLGSKYAVLIDSGIGSSLPGLREMLRTVGINKGDLKLIINTHGHWDHIGLNAVLKEEYNSLIVAHRAAVPLIENHQLQWKRIFGTFNKVVPPSKEQRDRFWREIGREVSVDISFEDELTINLGGGIKLDLIPTPGHSLGSICIYDHHSKTLFSGDSLLGRGVFNYLSMYVTVDGYLSSLHRLNDLDIRMILSSHLPVLKDEEARDFLRESESVVKKIEYLVEEELSESTELPNSKKIARKVCSRLSREFTFHSLFTIQAHLDKIKGKTSKGKDAREG